MFAHVANPITLVDRKILVSELICISNSVNYVSWQAALKPSAVNFNRSQKVHRKLKREVFGYS